MTITFDSVELKNPEIFSKAWGVITNQTLLLSGKRSVQASSELAIGVSFGCRTGTYSDVSNLRAKIGSAYSLVIDSDTYTNCYISSFTEREWYPDEWEYDVTFVRDTA